MKFSDHFNPDSLESQGQSGRNACLADAFKKLLEQIMAVVGAGGGFGMVLDAESRVSFMA